MDQASTTVDIDTRTLDDTLNVLFLVLEKGGKPWTATQRGGQAGTRGNSYDTITVKTVTYVANLLYETNDQSAKNATESCDIRTVPTRRLLLWMGVLPVYWIFLRFMSMLRWCW